MFYGTMPRAPIAVNPATRSSGVESIRIGGHPGLTSERGDSNSDTADGARLPACDGG